MNNGLVFLIEDKNKMYRKITPNSLRGVFEPTRETVFVTDIIPFGFETNVEQYGNEKRDVLMDTVNFLAEQAKEKGAELVLTDFRYADGKDRYGIHGKVQFYLYR